MSPGLRLGQLGRLPLADYVAAGRFSPSGLRHRQWNFPFDHAIAKAEVIAIGVSLDKPAVDPERHIAVPNDSREKIFRVPVYSKPSMSTT
jgi:hypothetical protein